MKLPSLVEIEINSRCNLTCSYCPNSVADRIENGDMDPKLFSLIIRQLKKYNYQGQMAFEFYNEPLLCVNLENFILEAKESLPLITIILYSNGTKLTKEKFNKLIVCGVDKFIITKHEGVKNIPFEQFFTSMNEEDRSHVSFQNHTEVSKYNRAGILPHLGSAEDLREKPCNIPNHILTISVLGNVLSCFEDFYQKYVFQNVKDANVIETWNSNPYNQFRNDLIDGKREIYSTCNKCNREDRKFEMNKNKHMIDELEIEAIKKVLDNGKLFRYKREPGECENFEKEFSNFLGTKHTSLVTSGTNALVAALITLNITEGDEVIIPSYTFVATASAVLTVGAIPVVVNIGNDLLISLTEIESAITERTKLIIPVHMDGLQCEIDKISVLAKEKKLFLVEDVAQALGASYKGKMLGSFGDLGCFSFNRDKTITCGEGGAVTTNNQLYSERLLFITDNAYQYNTFHKNKFTNITPFLGLSMRMSEISGAMLRIQLKKTSNIIEQNKLRKDILTNSLKNSKHYKEKFSIINSADPDGQCYSTIHLKFNEPDTAALVSKKFLSQKILIIPITLRLAHFVWKWNNILKPGSSYSKSRDPYAATDKKYNYSKINYLPSIDIIMSTLRGEIDITKTEEETKLMGIQMVKIIGAVCGN